LYEQRRTFSWQSDSSINKKRFEEIRNDYLALAQARSEKERQAIKTRITAREYQLSLQENDFANTLTIPSFNDFKQRIIEAASSNNIISYYFGDSTLYMIQISPHRIDHFILDTISTNDIQSFIQKYFYDDPLAFNNNPLEYYGFSNKIFNKYFPKETFKNHQFIIAPAGDLHQLPFEALCTDNQSPSFFGKINSISYLYSLLQLDHKPQKTKAGVVVFDFDQDHLGFPKLPQAGEEATFLSQLFATKRYSASEITNDEFFSSLNSNHIIHLAAHAVSGDSSDQPFIVLKNKIYLGQLQYHITKSPLVVLAACETGKGKNTKNEGLQSIGRAFISKGVHGVLSTRWQADDQASGEIIKRFYQKLKDTQKPSIALQVAQAEYLKNTSTIAELNPWLWANFFYQGNNNPIEVREKSSLIPEISILLFFITITVLFYFYKTKKKFSSQG